MDYEALAKQFGGSAFQQAQPEQTGPSWAQGLSPKDQAEVRMKMHQEGRQRLAELQSNIANAGSTVADLEEFGRLNRQASTGSWWQQMTPDKSMFRSPESMQMSAITSRLAPAQRQPGSGSSSDRDVAMFLSALPSIEKEGPANKGIREQYVQQYNRAIEKANAMKAYLDKYGHLMDFDSEWAQRGQQKPASVPQSTMSSGGWSAKRVN